MARARTWNLRCNRDEVNAAYLGLTSDYEKARWMDGWVAGMNGAGVGEEAPKPFHVGHEIGASMLEETEVFREGRRVNGAKSRQGKRTRHQEEEPDFEQDPFNEPCG